MKALGCILTRSSLFSAVMVLLGACTFIPGVSSIGPDCQEVDAKALKYVNWTQVPEVNVRIRQDEFSPMVIRLRQGWPYVIRIRNRDDSFHVFKAYDFFSSAAVIQTTLNGQKEDVTCYGAIVIPAYETAEIKLVATMDGRYEFEDNAFTFLSGFQGLPTGVIIVEERNPLSNAPPRKIYLDPSPL